MMKKYPDLNFNMIKEYVREAIMKMGEASCTKLEFSMMIMDEKWEVKITRK